MILGYSVSKMEKCLKPPMEMSIIKGQHLFEFMTYGEFVFKKPLH